MGSDRYNAIEIAGVTLNIWQYDQLELLSRNALQGRANAIRHVLGLLQLRVRACPWHNEGTIRWILEMQTLLANTRFGEHGDSSSAHSSKPPSKKILQAAGIDDQHNTKLVLNLAVPQHLRTSDGILGAFDATATDEIRRGGKILEPNRAVTSDAVRAAFAWPTEKSVSSSPTESASDRLSRGFPWEVESLPAFKPPRRIFTNGQGYLSGWRTSDELQGILNSSPVDRFMNHERFQDHEYSIRDESRLMKNTPKVMKGSPRHKHSMQRSEHDQYASGGPYGKYDVVKSLGQSTFGISKLVRNTKTGDIRCMKTVNKSKALMHVESLQKEFEKITKVEYPQVSKLLEIFQDYHNTYFVFEAIDGDTIIDVIKYYYQFGKYIDEAWLAEVFQQLLKAIAYCHSCDLIHTDLTETSIVMLRDKSKRIYTNCIILDFGLSKCFRTSVAAPRARGAHVGGTAVSQAPEVVSALMTMGLETVGPKCDIYSLGCVLFHLLSNIGMPPIIVTGKHSLQKCLRAIEYGPNWNFVSHITSEARDVLRKMMSVPSSWRPNARECLRHAWFDHNHMCEARLSSDQVAALIAANKTIESERSVMIKVATQFSAAKVNNANRIFVKHNLSYSEGMTVQDCTTLLGDLGVSSKTAQEAAMLLDVHDNGYVECVEFIRSCLSYFGERLRDHMWRVFTCYDVNLEGQILQKELVSILTGSQLRQGIIPPHVDVEFSLKSLDPMNTGLVSFQDFTRFFCPPICFEDFHEGKAIAAYDSPIQHLADVHRSSQSNKGSRSAR